MLLQKGNFDADFRFPESSKGADNGPKEGAGERRIRSDGEKDYRRTKTESSDPTSYDNIIDESPALARK